MTNGTISDVVDFLRARTPEDPIQLKSRERVLRTQAEGIKHNEAFKGGQCGICSRNTDKLMPVPMTCCPRCVEEVKRYGGGVRVIEPQKPGSVYCDKCLARTFQSQLINPDMCQFCLNKLGQFHKFNLPLMNKQIQFLQRKKTEATR